MGFSPGTLTFNYKQQACIVVLRNLNLKSQKKRTFQPLFPFFFQPDEVGSGSYKTQERFLISPSIKVRWDSQASGRCCAGPQPKSLKIHPGVWEHCHFQLEPMVFLADSSSTGLRCTAIPSEVSCQSFKILLCAQGGLDNLYVNSYRGSRRHRSTQATQERNA